MKKVSFTTKEDEAEQIEIVADEISETVPDADMRYTLLILNDGSKHFVKGTLADVNAQLGR